VERSNDLLIAPTQVDFRDGRASAPGFAAGSTLTLPGAGRYQMYLIFPLTQEVETLRVLRNAVVSTGVILVILLTFIAALVSRQVVTPVRAARRTAESIASGNLSDRMVVRGKDDLARLAISMNYMASELSKQITTLEELSAVQQRFVSDVSHELRTPLTTVRMAAEVLHEARDDFDPVAARSAELLQTELDRFEALLTDLLEISRFDAGAAVLTTGLVDLGDIVARVIEATARLAESRGVTVTVEAAKEARAEVDARRIERILRNLLVNAIEHSDHNPITVLIDSDDMAVAVAVRDHGIGFEAHQAKQVFHRFWRADPARARTVGGTGLGLSIAMEDANLHGGWLTAWGRPGLGAQFRLTLPRRPGVVLESSPLPMVPRDLVAPAASRVESFESSFSIIAEPGPATTSEPTTDQPDRTAVSS
jgi:two-component system sensor histidine kinase MtrB